MEKALSHGDAAARKLAALLARTLTKRGPKLRRLQKSALEAVRANLEAGNWDGLIKLPTGAGKTRLFCEISGALGLPTLVLVPRKSLVEQTGEAYRALQEDGGVDARARVSEVSSDGGTPAARQVQALLDDWGDGKRGVRQEIIVTTYQSLSSIARGSPDVFEKLFSRVAAVVSDEAHRSLGDETRAALVSGLARDGHVTWESLPHSLRNDLREEAGLDEGEALEGDGLLAALRQLAEEDEAAEALSALERSRGRKLHLLFTATPQLLGKSADDVSPYWFRATLADAANEGDVILPSLKTVGKATLSLAQDEKARKYGHIREEDLDRWADRFEIVQKDGSRVPVARAVTEAYLELRAKNGGRLPAVALCRTIDHAGRTVALLRSKGLKAERVTSAPDDIAETDAKARLQDGSLDVVVTVSKVAEGWDVPELSAALWYAPTQSPAKNLQANGRIMRVRSGKARGNVFIVEPESWEISRLHDGVGDGENDDDRPGDSDGEGDGDERSEGGFHLARLPNSVERMVELGELSEKDASRLYPGVKIEHLPETREEDGWTVNVLWPDGRMELGRAVASAMSDLYNAQGRAILRRLAAWAKSGTDEQKAWYIANVKDPGARTDAGRPVTVVRASVLEKFCHEECGAKLPEATEQNCWTVSILWPDRSVGPGRAVTRMMPNVYGVKGGVVLDRLAAWAESGTEGQRTWLEANVKNEGAKGENSHRITVVRASVLRDFVEGKLPCSDPCETNGWMVLLEWPDGKTEPGRAVTNTMSDVHGTKSPTVLRHLAAWVESGTDEQKAWLATNVKFGGARGVNGRLITVVRASVLRDFVEGKLPCSDPCEANGWMAPLEWPDGKMESGQAVTGMISDVYGVSGSTVLRRLAAWAESGTDEQKAWLAANVKFGGARGVNGRLVTVVRASVLRDFVEGKLPCSDPCEANGWEAFLEWPDGKAESGRAVASAMPNLYNTQGRAILSHLAAWAESGTDEQKAWLTANVKPDGAKIAGHPVTVVRASALKWFVAQFRGKKQ